MKNGLNQWDNPESQEQHSDNLEQPHQTISVAFDDTTKTAEDSRLPGNLVKTKDHNTAIRAALIAATITALGSIIAALVGSPLLVKWYKASESDGKDQPTASAEQQPSAKPFRDCDECPEMVALPAGDFLMGSASHEKRRHPNESPQHLVAIRKPFALGRYEVTFEEFDAFVAGKNRRLPDASRDGRGKRPVIDVDWDDANDYCNWLGEKTGHRYQLPSEAMWEYAARAGGSLPTETRVNIDRSNDGRQGETEPAGSYIANGWGLHVSASALPYAA